MLLENLLKHNTEELQFAVLGELKDWREHHTTHGKRSAALRATPHLASVNGKLKSQ